MDTYITLGWELSMDVWAQKHIGLANPLLFCPKSHNRTLEHYDGLLNVSTRLCYNLKLCSQIEIYMLAVKVYVIITHNQLTLNKGGIPNNLGVFESISWKNLKNRVEVYLREEIPPVVSFFSLCCEFQLTLLDSLSDRYWDYLTTPWLCVENL